MVENLSRDYIQKAVSEALDEDVRSGDVTTESLIPRSARCSAVMKSRQPLVFSGGDFAKISFLSRSPEIQFEEVLDDGQWVPEDTLLMKISGESRAILTAERTALNFVQHLSAIATLTRQFVQTVSSTHTKILDTRKTTPGWRVFEKYAVRCGGGINHRAGLFDRIMVKDNHLKALASQDVSMAQAVRKLRSRHPDMELEIEADTEEQVKEALEAGADVILLDNMSLELLRRCVESVGRKAQTEASGGVCLASVREIAETGVDFISVGALTHSAGSVDIALDFEDF